jgi:hypothetical protein
MNADTEIPIKAAILHFGRRPDGYGGKAELARVLGITQNAIARWAGPNLPRRHAITLLQKPYSLKRLAKRKRRK